MIDPDGRETKFTHTDEFGNVLAVYKDGDLGVYKHDDAKNKKDVDKARRRSGSTLEEERKWAKLSFGMNL